jgi:uncharacterized protein (UPF0262 family)
MNHLPDTEYFRTITMDDGAVVKRSLQVEQERAAALADLLRENHFAPLQDDAPLCLGAYDARLSIADNRLIFALTSDALHEPLLIAVPVSAFRGIIRDYFMICESYFEAIKTADPYKLEAIDMGRRGIHNEGSEKLQALLAGKAEMDFDTARRLFTLMCVLHIK